MDVKSQIETDGGGIADGKGIVPVELHGAINSPLVRHGITQLVLLL
jgi:hypothetical protein